jgi:hypothetical protein
MSPATTAFADTHDARAPERCSLKKAPIITLRALVYMLAEHERTAWAGCRKETLAIRW